MVSRLVWCLLLFSALRLNALDNIFFGDRLVRVDLPEFKAERVNNQEDSFYLAAVASDGRTAMSVSINMDAYADSRTCRQSRWAAALKTKITRENIREYDHKDFAVVECDVTTSEGRKKNINAYYAKDGIAMTIHLVRTGKTDGKELVGLLDRIKIGEIPLVYQLCFKGREAMLQEDYPGALSFLRPALASENKARELQDSAWRDLVVWTGFSEAMNGNLQAAEEIFIQALKRDNAYPLFYYNLACVYAEKNQWPRALEALEQALRNRDRINPGQVFPDILEDPSFQPFKDDVNLRQLLKKYPVADSGK